MTRKEKMNMKSIFRAITFFTLSISLYLLSVDPIMVDGQWEPSWALYIDKISNIVLVLFIVSSICTLLIGFIEKKAGKEK